MIYLRQQLHFLQWLQEERGPFLNLFFQFLNFFDTAYFAFLLSLIIIIFYSRRWGLRVGFLLLFNGLINHLLKITFALPRPLFYDPSLPLVQARGYTFPSGGAQMSFLLGMLIIYKWPKKWPWAAFYILLISFSRLFLGVHFPIDILGGWIAGALVAGLFYAFVTFQDR